MTQDDNILIQYALVGNLLQGGNAREETKKYIQKYKFKPGYITDSAVRALYDYAMKETSDDSTILRNGATKISSDTLGKCLENVSTNPQDWGRVVHELGETGRLAELWATLDAYRNRKDVSFSNVVTHLGKHFNDLEQTIIGQAAKGGYSLDDLGDPIPEDENPDALFRGKFLEKGGGSFLVSVSGAGKSSLLMQLIFAWSVGRPLFGIEPVHPLRIGIFQTENSRQVLAQCSHDVQSGLRLFCDWSEEDLALAKKNIRFFDPEGRMGDEFLDFLREEQAAAKFDLVVIDPLTGVTDIDIADNAKANDYFCKKIDPIIRYNPNTKCGLLFIHHCNKPPAPNMRTGFGTDQYAQYFGAGASKLSNWMRSMIALAPANEPGQYYFTAAKNGEHLDWPIFYDKNRKPMSKPTRLIRHSTREEKLIFWHEVTDGSVPPTKVEKPCVTKDAARLANELQNNAMTLTDARKLAKEMFGGAKNGNAAYNELLDHLSIYNVVIKPTGISTQKVIGSEESVENAFSTLREKHLENVTSKFGKKS